MKTLGILGGMSSQATAEYYRRVNMLVNDRLGGWNTAEVLINSVNFANIERIVRTGAWDEAGQYLAHKALALERAGADLLICVSNTLHRVADAFTRELTIPFLHIVDPTGNAITQAGVRRAVLIGTKPVMEDDYLKRRFRERFAVEIIVPGEADQREIDRIIFDELVKGMFRPESGRFLCRVLDELRLTRGAEGGILGCTEFSLMLSPGDISGFRLFDTAALHVEAAVSRLFEFEP